ncbi:cyclin dependent kinase inhibitor 1Bb [Gadus macrocephalus]|uniref:cyclin dependent kinase inhibitor 1Bb n=1 Tax=Gadus chalcogrammus TaxID=1042646 RepID=UPI0024C4825C|nr:cyclin dependent kinase inhibitor 1Bb [Gadus chalcogrammus]XP_059916355.1 cyclin dependent kinase inhibitor 1Bb [Gadus macrocephalus]
MSNVRLSNGSPTLERTDARVSEHPKPSFCRTLFGPVDHEELKRELKGHFKEMEDDASAKWNFDFANHKPLKNGRFKWDLVDCKDLPDFYNQPPRSSRSSTYSTGNNNVDFNGNRSCGGMGSARPPPAESERCESQMDGSEQSQGQRKRPACNDTAPQSKRSYTSSDEVRQNVTRSAEHTPRKSSPKTQT